MRYNSYAFLINHVNIVASKKHRWITIQLTKKSLRLLPLFKKYGLVNSSLMVCPKKKTFKISPFVYKGSPFFKGVRLISTPSKVFTIKIKTLNILTKSLGSTILLIETSRGVVTHSEALKLNIGGRLLCTIN